MDKAVWVNYAWKFKSSPKLFILDVNVIGHTVFDQGHFSETSVDGMGDVKRGIDQNQFCCKFTCNCGYFVS